MPQLPPDFSPAVEPIGMVIGTMLFLSIPALFVMLYSSATVVF